MSLRYSALPSLWRRLMIGVAPAALLVANPAAAQTAQAPSIAQLNSQVQVLQQQMQQLQDQLKAAQSQLNAQQVQQTQQAQQAQVTAPPPAPPSIGGIQIGGVNLKFGGFAETAGIFRTRNEVADVGSDLNAIPFKNNPRNHESELRFSAAASRAIRQSPAY